MEIASSIIRCIEKVEGNRNLPYLQKATQIQQGKSLRHLHAFLEQLCKSAGTQGAAISSLNLHAIGAEIQSFITAENVNDIDVYHATRANINLAYETMFQHNAFCHPCAYLFNHDKITALLRYFYEYLDYVVKHRSDFNQRQHINPNDLSSVAAVIKKASESVIEKFSSLSK